MTSDTSAAFKDAKTSFVCAPSTFTFYTKTTTNSSKCPSPLFKGIPANSACKYKLIRMHKQLKYINIPSTVRFIGYAAFFLGQSGVNFDLSITFEFVSGRDEKVFIGNKNFARRTEIYVIYQSNIIPAYSSKDLGFTDATTYYICAPSSFTFYGRQTTTDSTKCPTPQYKERPTKMACTCKTYRRQMCFIVSSFLICLFSPTIKEIITQLTTKTSNKKIE